MKTAWTGFHWRFGSKHDVHLDNIVFGHHRFLTGGGTDEVGDFEYKGTYTTEGVKFNKVYTTGSCANGTPLTYVGSYVTTEEGTKIVGKYYWHDENDGDGFEIMRSKELEEKREAAFKSVVASMKVRAGLIRFFGEDLWMTVCKVLFLWYYNHKSGMQVLFTTISLVAGLLMTLAGPMWEARVAQVKAEASKGVPKPTIYERTKKKTGPSAQAVTESLNKFKATGDYKLLGDNDASQDYKQRLNESQKITRKELFTGNLDYVAVLMEKRHIPAEVIDVSITDVIAETSLIRIGLTISSAMFWAYTIVLPFLSFIPCNKGPTATAHLLCCVLTFFNVFMQIWCASLTKYGYLMLVHAPQRYGFDLGLSFLGFFCSYSSVAWIVMVKSCGVWLWQPAAFVYIVGMIICQAIPGIYFLFTSRHLPLALRLTQNNLLIALLKPNP